MDNSPSLQTYIALHMTGRLDSALAHFLDSADPSALGLDLDLVRDIGTITVNKMSLRALDIGDLPGSAIAFDAIVDTDLIVLDKDFYNNDAAETVQQRFVLRCRGDLACGLEDLEIYDVHVYDKRNPQSRPLSYALVPIIHREDLEQEAEAFLQKYCKEALEKPMPIDTNELARRMGLTVISRRISEDASIFGQIYFMASEPKLLNSNQDDATETIKPGTIIIDPNVVYLRNIGSRNNTIVHECVHWDLHRKAFMLKRLSHQNASQIQCRVVGGVLGDSDDTSRWMEWQANALAPRIQMPLSMFKQQADATIAQYQKKLGSVELCDLMPYVIADLADFYHVSKMAAKLRMIEAGYEEAECAYVYIDGHYVKPYAYKHGAIRRDQTYCIPAADAAMQVATNPLLQKAHHYLYIDSHFVLNSPKYVYHDGHGKTLMTDYARYHVDECCLAFDLTVQSKIEERYHEDCFLNRDKASPIRFRIVYEGENGELTSAQQNKMVSEMFLEETRLLNNLPNDYCKAWNAVLEWRGISQAKLSRRTGITEKTISNIINGHTIGTINNVVLMCLGAHLPYLISDYLIQRCGHKLVLTNTDHAMYNLVLQTKYTDWIPEIQNYLQEVGASML